VPDDVKRRRNTELLGLQDEISSRVHQSWVGRTVEVLVDQIREQSPAAARQAHHGPSGTPLTIAGKSSAIGMMASAVGPSSALSTNKAHSTHPETAEILDGHSLHAAPMTRRASGRTPGDLIVGFTFPRDLDASASLLGRIVPVRITGATNLLLQGRLNDGQT